MSSKAEGEQKWQPDATTSGTGHSWSDIASGLWDLQKTMMSDVIHGRANRAEAAVAVVEGGLFVAAAALTVPVDATVAAGISIVGSGAAAAGSIAMEYEMCNGN